MPPRTRGSLAGLFRPRSENLDRSSGSGQTLEPSTLAVADSPVPLAPSLLNRLEVVLRIRPSRLYFEQHGVLRALDRSSDHACIPTAREVGAKSCASLAHC